MAFYYFNHIDNKTVNQLRHNNDPINKRIYGVVILLLNPIISAVELHRTHRRGKISSIEKQNDDQESERTLRFSLSMPIFMAI